MNREYFANSSRGVSTNIRVRAFLFTIYDLRFTNICLNPKLLDVVHHVAHRFVISRSSVQDTQSLSSRELHKENHQGSPKPGPVNAVASETAAPPLAPTALGTVGAKIHRATTLARDVEGDVIHRVQKVRELSSIVLDEAGYDPGLRFVLVAVVVFLLFLLIVLLNKLIA